MTFRELVATTGMTREALAAELEVSVRQLYRWVSGKRTPPAMAYLAVEYIRLMKSTNPERR